MKIDEIKAEATCSLHQDDYAEPYTHELYSGRDKEKALKIFNDEKYFCEPHYDRGSTRPQSVERQRVWIEEHLICLLGNRDLIEEQG